MKTEDIAKKLEGVQTLESISSILKLKQTTCLNIISMLKKEGYLKKKGGGKQKRRYYISARKNYPSNGMFDILNKYAVKKVAPWFVHAPHSKYAVEDAIIDLILLNSIRVNIGLLRLFNHVKDWNKLYEKAKEKKICRNVGMLYDIARVAVRTKKMPNNIYDRLLHSNLYFDYMLQTKHFIKISKKWRMNVPLNKGDLYDNY